MKLLKAPKATPSPKLTKGVLESRPPEKTNALRAPAKRLRKIRRNSHFFERFSCKSSMILSRADSSMPPMNSSRTITVRSVKGSRSQLIFPLRTKSAAVVLISAGTFNLGSGPHHSAQTFSYAVQRIPSDPLGCIVAITVAVPHAFKLPRYGVRGNSSSLVAKGLGAALGLTGYLAVSSGC